MPPPHVSADIVLCSTHLLLLYPNSTLVCILASTCNLSIPSSSSQARALDNHSTCEVDSPFQPWPHASLLVGWLLVASGAGSIFADLQATEQG